MATTQRYEEIFSKLDREQLQSFAVLTSIFVENLLALRYHTLPVLHAISEYQGFVANLFDDAGVYDEV